MVNSSNDQRVLCATIIGAIFIKDDIADYSNEEVAIRAFKEMDANKDGSVTRDEFVAAVTNHKKFSQFLANKIFHMFF